MKTNKLFRVDFAKVETIYSVFKNCNVFTLLLGDDLIPVYDFSGNMHRIADELGLNVDTVRNFFGGHNFKEGKSVGIHLEPGPDGGLVMIDDTTVLDRALKILDEIAGEAVEPVRA